MTRRLHTIEEVEALGGYRVIYADPCWSYKQGGRGVAENHYSTMSTTQIAEMPVSRIAAKDSVLFLWGTWPNLFETAPVITGWGYRFKTLGFLWVKHYEKSGKPFWGGGFWSRSNSEFCLLATRGDVRRISASVHQLVETWDEQEDLVLRAPVGRHSAKPPEVRERIEKLMGDVPRIELFARERTQNWDAFGDQVPDGSDVDLLPKEVATPGVAVR